MSEIRKANSANKSAIYQQLSATDSFVILGEIVAETGWRPHSCRTFLSDIRKSGNAVIKLGRTDGGSVWRVNQQAELAE